MHLRDACLPTYIQFGLMIALKMSYSREREEEKAQNRKCLYQKRKKKEEENLVGDLQAFLTDCRLQNRFVGEV